MDSLSAFANALLYSAVWLAALVLFAHFILRVVQPQSLDLRQAVWFLVLLPGVFLFTFRVPVGIPIAWDPVGVTTLLQTKPTAFVHATSPDWLSTQAHFDVDRRTAFSGFVSPEATVIDTSLRSNGSAADGSVADGSVADELEVDQNRGGEPSIEASTGLFLSESTSPMRRSSPRQALLSVATEFAVEPSTSQWFLPQHGRWIHYGPTVIFIWALGVVYLTGRSTLQFMAFQFTLHRDAIRARRSFQRQWRCLLKSCQVDRPIALVEHPSLGPLLTVTPRGMTVVVPADYWEELTPGQRLGILRHELAHYLRRDILSTFAARLMATLQWFNPLAWYALRRFDECVEWGCDASVRQDMSIQITDYAQALVRLLEFPHTMPVATRAARGSSIAQRVRMLLSASSNKDSKMKRILMACLVALMFLFACVRFDVHSAAVALPTETANARSDAETDQPLATFIAKLRAATSEQEAMIERFREEATTQAGQVVMASTTYEFENRLREAAESQSNLAVAAEYFDRSGDRYVLKPDQSNYANEFLAGFKQFEQDTVVVGKMLREYGNRMTSDSEVNQLVKRHFLDPEAAAQIYLIEVRDFVQPDFRVVKERWEEIFVLDRTNRLVIRSGAKRNAEQMLKQMNRAQQTALRLHREAGEWRRDLSALNPLSKATHDAMGDMLFAALFATESMNEDYGIEQQVDDYFETIENMFTDKADGLEPSDERASEVEENIAKFRIMQIHAQRFKPLMALMVSQLSDDLPNRVQWQNLLQSDIGLALTIRESSDRGADVESVLKGWLDQWIEEVADGKLSVRADFQEDQLYTARQWLRNTRDFRRKGLEIVEFGKQVEHPGLSAAYQKTAGKCMVMRMQQDRLSRQYFDGLGAWIVENFDASDDGYTLKEGHDYALENILSSIDNVKQELANDDF